MECITCISVVSAFDLGHSIEGWGFWFGLGFFVREQFWPLLYFWQRSLSPALSHGHYLHTYTSLFHCGISFFHISSYLLPFLLQISSCFRTSIPCVFCSTALIRQESRGNQQLYISYIPEASAKPCLDFDT